MQPLDLDAKIARQEGLGLAADAPERAFQLLEGTSRNPGCSGERVPRPRANRSADSQQSHAARASPRAAFSNVSTRGRSARPACGTAAARPGWAAAKSSSGDSLTSCRAASVTMLQIFRQPRRRGPRRISTCPTSRTQNTARSKRTVRVSPGVANVVIERPRQNGESRLQSTRVARRDQRRRPDSGPHSADGQLGDPLQLAGSVVRTGRPLLATTDGQLNRRLSASFRPPGMQGVGIDLAREGLGRLAELGVNAAQPLFVQKDARTVRAMRQAIALLPRRAGMPDDGAGPSGMPSAAVQFCATIRCRSSSGFRSNAAGSSRRNCGSSSSG